MKCPCLESLFPACDVRMRHRTSRRSISGECHVTPDQRNDANLISMARERTRRRISRVGRNVSSSCLCHLHSSRCVSMSVGPVILALFVRRRIRRSPTAMSCSHSSRNGADATKSVSNAMVLQTKMSRKAMLTKESSGCVSWILVVGLPKLPTIRWKCAKVNGVFLPISMSTSTLTRTSKSSSYRWTDGFSARVPSSRADSDGAYASCSARSNTRTQPVSSMESVR
jgi:hypothetical protein